MQLRTVNISDWTSGDPSRRAHFVRSLGLGLEELGFVNVEQPGLDVERLSQAYALAADTFALPVDTKLQGEQVESGRQRGYTPFRMEHAKNHSAADLKEFWQVGRHLAADHPKRVSGDVPANVYPSGIESFQATFDPFFVELEQLADHLLEAIGMYLGLDDGTFQAMTKDASSVLRVIHYPPLEGDVPDGAVRAAAHEDINLITVLPVSTAAGLELLTREGKWVAVETAPGDVVVDTGDMMALLTNGRLPATTHRVVNPTDPELASRSRYSMPFFVHPAHEVRLNPFDGSKEGPTAGEFFTERMVATGVRTGS